MVDMDAIRGEGGSLVQVGITRNGESIVGLDPEWVDALAKQTGIEAVEVVDEGVFLAVVPALLAEQLEEVGWFRVEVGRGVFVVEAEMP